MPVLRKPPKRLFEKTVLCKGFGFHTPQDGSVCKIKVISGEANLLSTKDNTKEIIVGDVDDPFECMIEDCIRTMKEEEECHVIFEPPNVNLDSFGHIDSLKEAINEVVKDSYKNVSSHEPQNVNSPSIKEECLPHSSSIVDQLKTINSESEKGDSKTINTKESASAWENPVNRVMVQLQLLSYTREPEIWEMSITEKWRRASYHKQKGLELYDCGTYQYAFRRFGLTLKYVISLEHDVPCGQEEGMDIRGLKLSCYLNVAACQMRHQNFESVIINSSRALMLHPNNAKALYRRGAAYLQLQEYEKAKADLTAAQLLEPKNQAILKQLQILKSNVQELNKYYTSAMKTLVS